MSKQVERLALGLRVTFAIFGAFSMTFGLSYWSASQEAKYYNQLTGNNVTVWQAFNVDLIVMTCLKPEKANQ